MAHFVGEHGQPGQRIPHGRPEYAALDGHPDPLAAGFLRLPGFLLHNSGNAVTVVGAAGLRAGLAGKR